MLSPGHQPLAMWAIFAVTYVGIALGGFPRLVLDRTGIALLGGIGMLVVHGIGIREAAAHVDYETILLLFGLMIFSAQLRVAGFYVWTGRFLTRMTDRPRRLIAGIIAVSALLSALLANDIVCLAFTPLLCESLLAARRDPVPYLLALATSSNIGSAATIIGNPQNMYIGAVAHLPFGHFSLVMIPIVLVGLVICWAVVVFLFRRRLDAVTPTMQAQFDEARTHEGETLAPSSLPLQTRAPERDGYLVAKTLIILAALVIFFLVNTGPNSSEWRAIAALAGAGLLLCSRNAKAARLYQLVDWNLLLLFLGLFVVNGAMKERHLTAAALNAIAGQGIRLDHAPTLAGVTVVLSNLVSKSPPSCCWSPPCQRPTAPTYGTCSPLSAPGPATSPSSAASPTSSSPNPPSLTA